MLIATTVFLDQILTNELAASPSAGALHGLSAAVFTNSLAPTKDSTWADITIPTFPGYAPVAVTWSPIHNQDTAGLAVDTQLLAYQMSDATDPQALTGWALYLPGAPNVLYGVELFDEPIALATALDIALFVGQFGLGLDAGFGQVTVIG